MRLYRYPVPLSNGETGYLHLPPYGVTHDDAERVRQMIDSLVIEVDPRPYDAVCWFLSTVLARGLLKHVTEPVAVEA